MEYLYLILKSYGIGFVFVVIFHEILNKILKKDFDSSILIFLFSILNLLREPIKGVLIIFLLPFGLMNNILLMIQKEEINPLMKEYCEYFKYQVIFSKETLKELESLLIKNKISYKRKYLVNISSYFLKSMHEINEPKDVSLTKNKQVILMKFSIKLQIPTSLAIEIFNLIEKELFLWIENNKNFND